MSEDAAFLLYALFFRFGIVGAGSFSIYLGYSLLRDARGSRGVRSAAGSSAEAAIPGARFKLTNVAAGTIFAMFGAVLVVAMVLQGNPEKTRITQRTKDTISETTKLRGDGADSIQALLDAGRDADKGGLPDEGEKLYRKALAKTAPAMNSLAWIYSHNGNASTGLYFSQVAVNLDGSNAHYLDTLAESEAELGDWTAALKAIEKAAELDPAFKSRREELQRRTRQK